VRVGQGFEVLGQALAAFGRIDRFEAGRERPRLAGLAERQQLVAAQQGFDGPAEPRPELNLAGNRPLRGFAHEAGIHQDGIIKNPLTYEIITPQAVGVPARQLVLGKHSGRNALRVTLKDLGFEPSTEELAECYRRVNALADESKNVRTRDVLAIANQVIRRRIGLQAPTAASVV